MIRDNSIACNRIVSALVYSDLDWCRKERKKREARSVLVLAQREPVLANGDHEQMRDDDC
jgi:hypothetical protein